MTREDRSYFQRRIAVESAMALAATGAAAHNAHAQMAVLYKTRLFAPAEAFIDDLTRREG